MSDPIYAWYKATRKLIQEAGETNESQEVKDMVTGWMEALETMEQGCPGLKERYERNMEIQASFTPEQIDFICYQIGDWYLDWKHRITTGDGHGHRLGVAKEHLKTMICGD